jgi:ankyrin repeat protein
MSFTEDILGNSHPSDTLPAMSAKSSRAKKSSASFSAKSARPHLNAAILALLTPFDLLQVAQTERAAATRIFGAESDESLWRSMCECEMRHVVALNRADQRHHAAAVAEDALDAGRALAAMKLARNLNSWQATFRHMCTRAFLEHACAFFTADFQRPDIEAMLATKVPGAYCVRPSSTGKLDCVLSANADGRVQHHLVVVLGAPRGVMLLGRHFRTLAAMLVGQDAIKLEVAMSRAPKLQDALAAAQDRVKVGLKALKSAAKKAAKKAANNASPPLVPDDRELLNVACRWGFEEEALAIIDLGVDVNLQDDVRRETALHCAVSTVLRADTTKVIEALLARKANLDLRDADGMTPLLRAVCQPGPHMSAVELLVKATPDTSVLRKGLPAPLIVIARGIQPIVDMFLAAPGKPLLTARGASGELALHVASRYGRKAIIDQLVAAGADVNARDADGATALHYTVKDERDWINLHMFGPAQRPMAPYQVCQLLVQQHQAKIDVRDKKGFTPMCEAAFRGQRSAVRALYEMGARGTAAARQAGVDGRKAPGLLQQIDSMRYFVYCGMHCQMEGFMATIAEQFDSIALTLAKDREGEFFFFSCCSMRGEMCFHPLVCHFALCWRQIVPLLTGFPLPLCRF